jgi:tellurium resistance protein TerD
MSVSLSKGANVSLSRTDPGLKQVAVGLGWNARSTSGDDFDLDAIAFMVKEDGKVRKDEDFIFYNNLVSSCGSVKHTGDNRSGAGDGDDEVVEVNLTKVPADIAKVVFSVTIHEADARRQNFGMVSGAFIRIVNDERGTEIARYDLSEEASTETAMIFGEIYRHSGEWKFRAIGQGFRGGLEALARSFGINI